MNALTTLLEPTIARLSRLFANRDRLSIGLELGMDRLNMVQMDKKGNELSIRAIASLPYSCSRNELYANHKALKALIKQAYATQPFKGKHVVTCLPSDDIKIITVAYKPIDGQQDSVPIVAELRERLQGELDEMVVDYFVLRQEESETGKRDALVAMAPRKKVLAYLKLLNDAGLNVDALDIGPAALARLVRHASAIHTPEYPLLPNILLVNFASEASYLTVIWGRRLMLDRTIEFSENRIITKLKQVLNMPDELAYNLLYGSEADTENGADSEIKKMVSNVLRSELAMLLQEINKTLVYMASKTRGKSVDKIYLSGHLARYPGIQQHLNEQLNVDIEVLDPITLFSPRASRRVINADLGTLGGIALTTGLALRGVQEHG